MCIRDRDDEGYEKLLDRLGEDPLNKGADIDKVWQRIHRSRAAMGTLLLNQSVIAGIGNVYRAEILFLLGIHPERPGNTLAREEFDELWQLTIRLLKIGMKYNRIITVEREHVDKPLSKLPIAERVLCYKKKKCMTCGTRIRQWELGSRKMYACEKCQKK